MSAILIETARGGAIAAGAFLIALSLLMILRPRAALAGLSRMGSTPLIHFGELALRGAAGAAIALAAPTSRHPDVLFWVGLFLVGSSALLAIAPRRWHAAYSAWWARRIPPASVPVFALGSLLAGGALVLALI